jgi:hypothetical protein
MGRQKSLYKTIEMISISDQMAATAANSFFQPRQRPAPTTAAGKDHARDPAHAPWVEK